MRSIIGRLKAITRNYKQELLLLLWGAVCALVLVSPYLHTVENGFIVPRISLRLFERYEALMAGADKFDIAHFSHVLGYGLYFPFLMKFFHISDGAEICCLVQAICGMVVICLYPCFIYNIYKNILLAVISPIILHLSVGDMLYINKGGEFFSALWAFSIGIPILFLLRNEKDEGRVIFQSSIILMVSMLANVMRVHSGAPLIFIWLILIIMKKKNKIIAMKTVIMLIVGCFFSYSLLGTTIPSFVASKWGVEGEIPYNSSPWHSILIGMGYIRDNNYGLYYNDDSARDLVAKEFPDIEYLSEDYFEKCKAFAIQILVNDPHFVFKGWLLKFQKSMTIAKECFFGNKPQTVKEFRLLIIFSCVMMSIFIVINNKLTNTVKDKWKDIMTIVMIIIISAYPGVVAVPDLYYNWGSCGATGILLMFIFFMLFDGIMTKEESL